MRWFPWLKLDGQLEDEQQFHIDMRIREYVAGGMTPEQARLRALRQFGNRTLFKERTREMHISLWFETGIQDLRYAFRTLLASPGFTVVAVLSLALGIAANTTIFSAVNALLLRPLPYPQADRLVAIRNFQVRQPDRLFPVSAVDLRNLADVGLIQQMEGSSNPDMTAMSGAGEPERVGMVAISPGFLSILGVKPALGRLPTDADFGLRSIVLSYGFWQRHFGRDPDVLGKRLVVDHGSWTVIGVLMPEFDFFGQGKGDIYRIIGRNTGSDTGRWLFGVGRLKPGVSLAQAQASIDATVHRLESVFPKTNKGLGVRLQPLQEGLFGGVRPILVPLFVAVGFVLLIACTNIANLLLSRAATRRREIGVRAAIGATRQRLIRQMLTETVLLSLFGGGLGLALAFGGVKIFVALAPRWMPQAAVTTVDWRVLVFTMAISILTGILFGLAPALRASRVDWNMVLKDGGPAGTGAHRHRTRSTLVVMEVALALVLLAAAGLMMNSFIQLLRVDPGFKTNQLLSLEVRLLGNRYFDTSQYAASGVDLVKPEVTAFSQQLLERVKALPGVEEAALINWLPMGENQTTSAGGIRISGASELQPGQRPMALFHAISADYFHVMQIPLLRGRQITPQDQAANPWVVVINEAMARRFWPNQDPIGQVVTLITVPEERPREVVGIVGNVRQFQLNRPPLPEMYIPYEQQPVHCTAEATESRLHQTLVWRTRMESKSIFNAVRESIRQLDRDSPVFGMQTLTEAISNSAGMPRFYSQLLGGFAALALLLSAIGIYGVISYSVNERSREIGLRLALGAQSTEILRLIVGQGLLLAGLGIGLGLAAAYAATPILGKFLFGVKPHDPLTLGLVTVFLIAVTMLATYLPARRAIRLDPVVTLRHQ